MVHRGRAEIFALPGASPVRPIAGSLLNDSRFGSPILGPGGFAVSWICRHFHTKAYGLNSRTGHAQRDQIISGRLSPSLTQRAIVFVRAALIGKPGQDDIVLRSLHEIGDLPELTAFGGLDLRAIVGEVDRRKLVSRYVATEERRSFLSFRQGTAIYSVTFNAGVLLLRLLRVTGGQSSGEDT
jgi:hypothetical protein